MTEAEQKTFLPTQQAVNMHEDDEVDNEPEQNYTELREEFRQYHLVQFMQYSNTLYLILHDFDRMRYRLPDFVAKFGFGPKEIAVSFSSDEALREWSVSGGSFSHSRRSRFTDPTTSTAPTGLTT